MRRLAGSMVEVDRGIVRTLRRIAVVVLTGALAACSGGDRESIGERMTLSAGPGPVDTSSFEDVVRVTPHLDDALAVRKRLGLAGGSVSVEAADGTRFTLEVPANALRFPVEITMTPVARIDGLPFDDGPYHAVDFRPNGLVFDVPAVLTITAADAIDVAEQIHFAYRGSELILARPVPDSAAMAMEIDHFSGYGVAKGLLGDLEEVRKRLGGDAEARISSEASAYLAEQRRLALSGEDPGPNRLQEFFDQFAREVLAPRLAAAGESCAAGRVATQTYLQYRRDTELLGMEHEVDERTHELIDSTTAVCMREEYEMCANEHVIHRLIPFYHASARSSALIGTPSEETLSTAADLVKRCMRFELDFTASAVGQVDWAIMTVRSEDTATFTTELVMEDHLFEFAPSSATMESEQPVYDVIAKGCTVDAPDPWKGPAEVVGFWWTPTDFDDSEELGEVDSITVQLQLPDLPLRIPAMTCSGRRAGGFEDRVTSALVFKVAKPDQTISEWTIAGGDDYAVATWEIPVNTGTPGWMNSTGRATLRHKPR